MFEFSAKFLGDRKRAFDVAKEHPIILSLMLCLFLCSISFMEQYYVDERSIFTVFLALTVLAFCACLYLRAQYGLKYVWAAVLFIALEVLSVFMCKRLGDSARKTATLLIFCMLILIALIIFLVVTKKMTVGAFVIIIFIGAIFTRFAYISITSISTRAHDVVNYGGTTNPYTEGHMGYILYLYNNNFALPDVLKDGDYFDQAYHPPLHHFIAAVWLKIMSFFKVGTDKSLMSVQTLTLFYSAVSTIYAYKIFNKFKIDGKIKVLLFLIIAFHPSFIYMAADVNNDMLSVALMFVALYHALNWHESGALKDIIFTALAIGFAMMAKLSAYLICVPIGIIFAVRFFGDIRAKKQLKPLIIQFAVFIAICAPLGLFSPIKNSIKYGLPLTFVQRLSNDSWQYVGNYPIAKRLFDFRSLFTCIYDVWPNRVSGADYHEFNPLVALIKTSVFEEYINNSGAFAKIDFWAHVLYVSNIIIILVSLASAIYMLVRYIVKKKFELRETAIAAGYLVMLASYYVFCFQYPHHCTENMRYVTPLILYGLIFIGRAFNDFKEVKEEKNTEALKNTYAWFNFFTYAAAIAFAMSTYGMVLKMIRA